MRFVFMTNIIDFGCKVTSKFVDNKLQHLTFLNVRC